MGADSSRRAQARAFGGLSQLGHSCERGRKGQATGSCPFTRDGLRSGFSSCGSSVPQPVFTSQDSPAMLLLVLLFVLRDSVQPLGGVLSGICFILQAQGELQTSQEVCPFSPDRLFPVTKHLLLTPLFAPSFVNSEYLKPTEP